MTDQAIITYWLEKGSEDLASAKENLLARRFGGLGVELPSMHGQNTGRKK